jgi:hypothetical protein
VPQANDPKPSYPHNSRNSPLLACITNPRLGCRCQEKIYLRQAHRRTFRGLAYDPVLSCIRPVVQSVQNIFRVTALVKGEDARCGKNCCAQVNDGEFEVRYKGLLFITHFRRVSVKTPPDGAISLPPPRRFDPILVGICGLWPIVFHSLEWCLAPRPAVLAARGDGIKSARDEVVGVVQGAVKGIADIGAALLLLIHRSKRRTLLLPVMSSKFALSDMIGKAPRYRIRRPPSSQRQREAEYSVLQQQSYSPRYRW